MNVYCEPGYEYLAIFTYTPKHELTMDKIIYSCYDPRFRIPQPQKSFLYDHQLSFIITIPSLTSSPFPSHLAWFSKPSNLFWYPTNHYNTNPVWFSLFEDLGEGSTFYQEPYTAVLIALRFLLRVSWVHEKSGGWAQLWQQRMEQRTCWALESCLI